MAWTTSTALVSYPFNDAYTIEISDNKSKGYEWIKQFGVRAPETIEIVDDAELERHVIEELLSRHKRVIVKPDGSFGSRGVTVDLTTYDQVAEAVRTARSIKQRYDSILIQQQVEGDEFRFTVLQGKVVSVMLRETAQIVGDGKSSIAELIEREDSERETINRTSLVRYPTVAEIIHDRTLLTSPKILPKGISLSLASSAMVSGGTSVYEVASMVDESYMRIAEKLAQELGAGFIVVDLFIADHTIPATSTNVYFNEFNRSPALKMLYASRNNNHVDIAKSLAEAIDEYLSKSDIDI